MAISLDKQDVKHPVGRPSDYQALKIRSMEREIDLLFKQREDAALRTTKWCALMFVIGALSGVVAALWLTYLARIAD